jgi:hypothetical protein
LLSCREQSGTKTFLEATDDGFLAMDHCLKSHRWFVAAPLDETGRQEIFSQIVRPAASGVTPLGSGVPN